MKFRTLLPDLLIILGTLSVSYGTWLIYEPAGYIIAGALVLILGIMDARTGE